MVYLKNVSTLKLFPEKCTGCKKCTEVCPRAVFDIIETKAQIINLDNCIECGACLRNCAFDAIRVEAGVGCASAIINGMLTGGEPTCGCSDDSSSGSSGCC
ncbi:MAG: 4Fe-4S dicluster domain-containing protein [bacterium]|nr:4Fe-4S dicluster domain-containing protein [bacterium]